MLEQSVRPDIPHIIIRVRLYRRKVALADRIQPLLQRMKFLPGKHELRRERKPGFIPTFVALYKIHVFVGPIELAKIFRIISLAVDLGIIVSCNNEPHSAHCEAHCNEDQRKEDPQRLSPEETKTEFYKKLLHVLPSTSFFFLPIVSSHRRFVHQVLLDICQVLLDISAFFADRGRIF